mgnify:CR=1 FL=1
MMQEIAHMVFYAGFKQKDVAAQLGITPAAVNMRYKKMMEEVVTPYVIENYGEGLTMAPVMERCMDDRLAIDRALNDLRDALKGEDAAKMKSATDAALQASQKLGEAMYKSQQANASAQAQQAGAQAGANAGAQAGAANNDGKDDVVEAEVVDK